MTKLLVITILCLLGQKTVLSMPVAENQEPLQVVPLEKSASPSDSETSAIHKTIVKANLDAAEPAPAEAKPAEAKPAEAEKPSVRSEPVGENAQLSEKAEEKKEEAQQPKPEEKKEEAGQEKKPEQLQPQQQPQEAQQPEQEQKPEQAQEAKKEEEGLKQAASESHETVVQVVPQEKKQDSADVLVEQPVVVSLNCTMIYITIFEFLCCCRR